MKGLNLCQKEILTDEELYIVAELIYDTDPFIYPALFNNKTEGIKGIVGIFKSNKDAMFSLKNLYIAYENEQIAGIILWHKGELSWDSMEFRVQVEAVGVRLADTFEDVCDRYFKSYESTENLNVSIINLCVGNQYRRKGIAYKMLMSFIRFLGDYTYELCCLEDNISAIHLYEKCGFVVNGRRKAFTVTDEEIYALTMIRKSIV